MFFRKHDFLKLGGIFSEAFTKCMINITQGAVVKPSDNYGVVSVEIDQSSIVLRNLAVRPSFQGKGIGRKLVDFVERKGKEHNLLRVRLWTREEMTDNIRFYRQLDYEVTHFERTKKYSRIFLEKNIRLLNKHEYSTLNL